MGTLPCRPFPLRCSGDMIHVISSTYIFETFIIIESSKKTEQSEELIPFASCRSSQPVGKGSAADDVPYAF